MKSSSHSSKPMPMLIRAIKTQQNDNNVFSTKLSVADLDRYALVDAANPDTGTQGYQRLPNRSRYHQIANYLAYDNSMMPPAIVVSFRGHLPVVSKDGDIYTIEIPDDENLWVIDGQHRLGGLRLLAGLEKDAKGLINNDFQKQHARFKKFEMPVVIIECPDIKTEAFQFAKINSEAKKVNKYLANESILQGGGPSNGGSTWLMRAVELTKFMNDHRGSPLKGMMKHPNSKRDPNRSYYCSTLGFTNSLDPLMNDNIYGAQWEKGDKAKIQQMVAGYWSAWHSVIPFAFEDHKGYALFKNSGMMILNYCMLTMARRLRVPYPTEEDFLKIITKLKDQLKPEYWDVDSGPVNRCVGKGQIMTEARNLDRVIL